MYEAIENIKSIENKAGNASDFLQLFSNKSRLLILCTLFNGKKTVNEIVLLTLVKQAFVSKNLMLLKQQKVVKSNRKGRYIYYEISDETVKEIIAILYKKFCK